jgi:hypothetical protein
MYQRTLREFFRIFWEDVTSLPLFQPKMGTFAKKQTDIHLRNLFVNLL